MTHRLSAFDEYGGYTAWFLNALRHAMLHKNLIHAGRLSSYDKLFKTYYGFNIIGTVVSSEWKTVEEWHVEFPSEADAIMFVLRWS